MKGYTSANDVAAYMGLTFSVAQAALAALAIGAAESWIDHNTRHAWLEAGPIVETIKIARTSLLTVAKPPVKEFTQVSAVWWPGAEATVLDATTGMWFVRNLRDGIIWAPFAFGAYELTVTYVPNDDAVPDEVKLATNVMAAAALRMIPSFNDDVDPTIVQRYVVGGELEVEFRKVITTNVTAGQQALTYLDMWVKGYSVI